MKEVEIWIDMDGVLCDLVGKLCEEFHFNINKWPEGEYDLSKVFKVLYRDIRCLWDDDFFENLKWTKDGKAIHDLCRTIVNDRNTHIVSSFPQSGASGKTRWVERELPFVISNRNLHLSLDKSVYAQENRLLLDDCEEDVDSWNKEGGRAILVPRPWNIEYKDQDFLMLSEGIKTVTRSMFSDLREQRNEMYKPSPFLKGDD